MLTLSQPIRLTGGYGSTRKRVYVYATGPSSMEEFYPELEDDPAWEVKTIHCGHDQMIDAPDEVADILVQSAIGAARYFIEPAKKRPWEHLTRGS